MPFLSSQQSRLLGNRAGIATPIPTYGNEILVDGGMEQWASATDLTQWSETLAGTSTVNREATTIRSGTYSARLDVDSSSNNAQISTTIAGTVGDFKLLTVWAKASANGKTARLAYGAAQMDFTLTTSWQQLGLVHRYTATSHSPLMRALSAASASVFFDDASVKTATLASMFATRDFGSAAQDVSAPVTLGLIGTRAGVVARLDNAATPTAFLIASHDGINCRLTQLIGGTWTELRAGTPTYVAGAAVRIYSTGTTAKLYYNGTQVGADATCDAGLTGTLAGKFNTFSGNTIGPCAIVAAA